MEIDVEIPEAGGEGVMVAAGSHFGGWSFYFHHGRPTAFASISPLPLPGNQTRVMADKALSAGTHKVGYEFQPAGEGGTLRISVDGEQVASAEIANRPKMLAGNGETFDTGRDTNVPVSPDYQAEGGFNGDIRKVDVKVSIPSQPGTH